MIIKINCNGARTANDCNGRKKKAEYRNPANFQLCVAFKDQYFMFVTRFE